MIERSERSWLKADQAQIMGILNITPDSFSDGGLFLSAENAAEQARRMEQEGASIIDIGGESTRPGALPVTAEQELERVIPAIRAIREHSQIPISIDTSKPEVMREAVKAGASLVNDVYGLRTPGALEAAVELEVPVCIMHMQGEPRTMQANPRYSNVVEDVYRFLSERVQAAVNAGIAKDKIIVDPGFGFGKTVEQNMALLYGLARFRDLGCPVLIGVSRKSTLGAILDRPVDKRLAGSLAAAVLARIQGADIIRVHDVAETVDALKVLAAMKAIGEYT
ncbi:MAG: dihydropteroate synthase [Gammaproteobacteria bacterium]|nr:dihydropteroate synthase [Gammaproteobacteria bacterium]